MVIKSQKDMPSSSMYTAICLNDASEEKTTPYKSRARWLLAKSLMEYITDV